MHGKPMLDTMDNPLDLQFNLSHTEGDGLLGVAAQSDLGVDIESIRPAIETENLARRYFSPREVADLLATPAMDRGRRFFEFWAAKESYVKGRGLGLHIPLDAFDVPLTGGPGPFRVTDRHTPAESGRWSVYPVRVADPLAAAVASPEPIKRIQLFRWPESRGDRR